MRKYLTSGAVGAILTPVTIDADGKVGKLTALTTGQLDGFVGFSGQVSNAANRRINVHVEGDLFPGEFVRGEEYYLSLTGPVLRSSLADGTLTRLIGRAESSTRLRLKYGSLETIGAAAVNNAFVVNLYEATSTYPVEAALRTWHDLSGDGGDVDLPAGAGLEVGDALTLCRASIADPDDCVIVVVPNGSDTINGGSGDEIKFPFEHYTYFWTGSEWRIKSA